MSKKIKIEDLYNFCVEVMLKEGFSREQAEISAEVLTTTDAFGVHSHGTRNLHNYFRKARLGGIGRDLEPEIIKEGGDFALIDANAVIGMVPAYKAMKLAIEKAKDNAITCVTVKNASHFGAAGYYALMAAKEGMIGMTFTCGDRNTTVPGGRGAIIGNNPLAYAIPTDKHQPIFMDIAFSTVAALKIVQAQNEGRTIPDTWLADENGIPTTDPSGFPDKAALLPMSAHKGYGLSMMSDFLTSVLSGGAMVMDIHSWLYYLEEKNNVAHTFIAIDVSKFIDKDEFKKRADKYIDYLHNSPKAAGSDKIYYPGEIEWGRYENAKTNGLALPPDTVESLEGLSLEMGIPLNWL